ITIPKMLPLPIPDVTVNIYKVHIQYTFNAFCKVVIRHAAIDIILKLRRRWEREVSLDYLMNEKFVQLVEPEQLEEYLFTACGQTAVLYHAELAAALALDRKSTRLNSS